MCTAYKVPLWSLSLILVRGTFLVFFTYIHKVYFSFLSVTSTAVLYCYGVGVGGGGRCGGGE